MACFTQVFVNKSLEGEKGAEQPLPAGHVMMDHIHVASQLTEKNKECRMPLWLLIYFEEVFHSIEHSTVLTIEMAEKHLLLC